MAKLPKPLQINQPNPEISKEQATITSISRDIIELKKELNDQKKENKNFTYWIIGSVVAIVAIVAIEIILFHTRADKDYLDLQNQYFQEVKELQKDNSNIELRLQKEIDELKAKVNIIEQRDSQIKK